MNSKNSYGLEHDLNLKCVIALNRTINTVNKRSIENFRSYGLTMNQFAVLEVLYHKGELRIKDIMEKILSTGGNMTVVIQNLERDGYIEKCQDPKDSRASLIKITKQGEEVMKCIFPKHLVILNDQFHLLQDEEKQQLITLLKKIGV